MNPNLNYAQMARGPEGQVGQHTGVLDLKSLVKIASGLLILRDGKSEYWTTELNDGFVAWARKYIDWLETAEIALEEGWADKYVHQAQVPCWFHSYRLRLVTMAPSTTTSWQRCISL